MTLSDISAWCNDHVMMPSRVVYNSESGNKVVFDNGDSYEYQEREKGMFEKVCKYFINGELVNETVFAWHNFGWKAV